MGVGPTSGQLTLDLDPGHDPAPRVLNKAAVGLAKVVRPGPERLVSELVKRGMSRDHLAAAAALALLLDAEPVDGERRAAA
jgi:hypothetical protein